MQGAMWEFKDKYEYVTYVCDGWMCLGCSWYMQASIHSLSRFYRAYHGEESYALIPQGKGEHFHISKGPRCIMHFPLLILMCREVSRRNIPFVNNTSLVGRQADRFAGWRAARISP